MTADQVAELMRMTLREALILSAPILVVAGVSSLLISLVQTLTSIQDQTLSTVPRLLIVAAVLLVGMPWFLHRLVWFTASILNDSPVRELIPMIAFPTEAAGWVHLLKAALLVCIRVSGLFIFAPIFSSEALPAKVKSVFLVVLTVVLSPVAAALPGSHVEVGLGSILGELGVTALLGLSLAMLNELASLAGQLLGLQFSFSLVNLLDPNSSVQTPLLSQMLGLLEITVLLAAGLHRVILAALLHTFLVVPLGAGLAPRDIGLPLVGMMGGIFLAALQLAAPVMSATLLVEVGIALMSRVSPQLPVLALTVPAKTVLGYVVLVGSLALWPAFFEARFDGLLNGAQRMLQVLAVHAP